MTSTQSKPTTTSTVKNTASANNSAAIDNLKADFDRLKDQHEQANQVIYDLQLDVEGAEKERDFYFKKLRDIEILLQEQETKGVKNELSVNIFKILYATAEGFDVIADEETTSITANSDVVADPIDNDNVMLTTEKVVDNEMDVEISESVAVEEETF